MKYLKRVYKTLVQSQVNLIRIQCVLYNVHFSPGEPRVPSGLGAEELPFVYFLLSPVCAVCLMYCTNCTVDLCGAECAREPVEGGEG